MKSALLRNVGAGLGLAAVIVLGSGAAAFAHECFIPNRSDQGNAKAGTNSQAWWTLEVEAAVWGDVEMGYLTSDQAECVLDAYASTGAPMSFTILVKGANGQHGTLGAKNPNTALMADGNGVDHLFASYADEIIGSYAECGAPFGG